MPDFAYTFTVRGINTTQATNLQTRLTNQLAQAGVTASAVTLGRITAPVRVLAVDTATRQVIDQTVDATDETDAANQITAANPNAVVAFTQRIG